MCGILGICGLQDCSQKEIAALRPKAIAMSKKLRSRGPDWSGCFVAKDAILCHERLAIVGVGESNCSSSKKEFGRSEGQKEVPARFCAGNLLFSWLDGERRVDWVPWCKIQICMVKDGGEKAQQRSRASFQPAAFLPFLQLSFPSFVLDKQL